MGFGHETASCVMNETGRGIDLKRIGTRLG